jgi:hypothetical protein
MIELLTIGDKKYAFDVEALTNFIMYSDLNKSQETEIIDSYDGGKVVSKTVRELTTPGNAQIDNIKYDLIKMFIVQIITYDEDVRDIEEVPFGVKLCLNTLIAYGFLNEIIEDNE